MRDIFDWFLFHHYSITPCGIWAIWYVLRMGEKALVWSIVRYRERRASYHQHDGRDL